MRASSFSPARESRLAQLRGLVEDRGNVPLADAARLLAVSAMTIRRDLAHPGATLACHGAHIVSRLPAPGESYTLDAENERHLANKRRASRHAAGLVRAGDSLFIDCGTTMPHLAAALPPDVPLDVVCYSMNVASILCRRPKTQVMLLGGLYQSSSATFFCEEAIAYLARLGIDKAFISAGGVHPERGASCSNFSEVPVKQAAIARAAMSVLVVDDSKLGGLKPALFAGLDQFSRIIVGGSPERRWRTRLKNAPLDIVT